MLPRQGKILKTIINEYVATAQAVPSQVLVGKYGLGVSPATVRNEMAQLEAEGYIRRPHTSAGSVPTDKGYRYFVETLEEAWELPVGEQRLIQHLFHQVEAQMDEWVRLAAALSARLTQNIALVYLPKPPQSRFRHLNLFALHHFLALLVLVLREATLREKLLPFKDAINQEQLDAIGKKFNNLFYGLTSPQIQAWQKDMPATEQKISLALVDMMRAEDRMAYSYPLIEGLSQTLKQPEFTNSERAASLLGIVESDQVWKAVLSQIPTETQVQVIIGEENKEQALQGLSLVITRYGIPNEARGIIIVIGPTRMRYGHTIATVRHLASVLDRLLKEIYGHQDYRAN